MRTGCSIVMDGAYIFPGIHSLTLLLHLLLVASSSAGSFFLGAVDCSVKRKDASFQLEILQQEIGGCVTTSGAGIDRGRSCLDHMPCACTQQCIAGYWED